MYSGISYTAIFLVNEFMTERPSSLITHRGFRSLLGQRIEIVSFFVQQSILDQLFNRIEDGGALLGIVATHLKQLMQIKLFFVPASEPLQHTFGYFIHGGTCVNSWRAMVASASCWRPSTSHRVERRDRARPARAARLGRWQRNQRWRPQVTGRPSVS